MSDSAPDRGLHKEALLAERSVLSGILRCNSVLGDVLQVLRGPADFLVDAHRRIFAAAVCLYEAGKPVDTVTLADELFRRKEIDDVRYDYLAELWDCCETAAHAIHHAEIVRHLSIARQLIEAGTGIVRDAHDYSRPGPELLEEAERRIFAIAAENQQGTTVELRAGVPKVFDALDARRQPAHRGNADAVPTGFADLDNLTGGLRKSELIVPASRPSVGKTAFGLAVAAHAIENGVPVFMASLEQSHLELTERMLSARARVDGHKMRLGTINAEEQERLDRAGRALCQAAKLIIDDTPSQSMLRIAANARRLKLREKIGLVIVDYLQLTEPENRRDPRHEQVAQTSRRLKALARELAVPVIALAQLNRSVEERQGRPRLSDLRESGSIEADADLVLLLHRPADNQHVVEVIIAKHRNGPVGEVTLAFNRSCTCFENYARESPPWT
jgi:replicative DNA helicase